MRSQLAVLSGVLFVSGSALAKAEDREVPDFSAVHISSGIHATVEIGPRKPVHLEGDAADLAAIEVVVEDGALQVRYRERSGWHDGHGSVTATIQTPQLHEVGASGGSIVRAA